MGSHTTDQRLPRFLLPRFTPFYYFVFLPHPPLASIARSRGESNSTASATEVIQHEASRINQRILRRRENQRRDLLPPPRQDAARDQDRRSVAHSQRRPRRMDRTESPIIRIRPSGVRWSMDGSESTFVGTSARCVFRALLEAPKTLENMDRIARAFCRGVYV